jgi:Rps23 Pro-64 3,4-dihydroxylase Tpa1-like proline 4-hydroxylase
MIQVDGQAEVPPAPSLSPAIAATAEISAPQGGDLLRYPVVQLDGFLSGSEIAWLMELTFAAESRFVRSRLTVDESGLARSQLPDQRDDYRHSLMLSAPHEVSELMTAKIKAVMPQAMAQLRIRSFAVGRIDCQITASVEGSYFKAHTDAGLVNETVKRQLTYVYYFNREPKGFTGGELRIYDGRIRDGKLGAAMDSYQVVEPRHNSIVFFRATLLHEVMPVTVPSKAFRDARFTVNGWVDRV